MPPVDPEVLSFDASTTTVVVHRTVEDLTKYINKCEEKINDLYDENEDLREKLGLDPKEPLDLGEYRKKKGLRLQEDRALNRVLQKEIEGLEEERLELKQQIRRLAQTGGTRAVAMGLSPDDLAEIDNFIDTLKEKNKAAGPRQTRAEAKEEALRIRVSGSFCTGVILVIFLEWRFGTGELVLEHLQNLQQEKDLETNAQKIERLGQENAEYRAKNKELEEENDQLEKGLREINLAIKEQSQCCDLSFSCFTGKRLDTVSYWFHWCMLQVVVMMSIHLAAQLWKEC